MRVFLAVLKVLAISAPLTWAWMEWGRGIYARIFPHLALPIYGWLGATSIVPNGDRERFLNYIPFLVLMLVTPRLSPTRRIAGTLLGMFAIFLGHVAFVGVADASFGPRGGITAQGFQTFFPALLLCDSMPFVLWAIIARDFVKEHAARIFESEAAEGGRGRPG